MFFNVKTIFLTFDIEESFYLTFSILKTIF